MAEASIKQPINDISGEHVHTVIVPAHLAATATEAHPIFYANGAEVKVKSILIISADDVTGVDSNTTHLNLINAGTDGTGTTELANYDLTDGNDLTGDDAYELYAPTTKLSMSAGGVLKLQHEKVGNGLLVPALLVVIRYTG